MKLLVIPDPHAHPDYDHERFSALGELVVRERPDVVLCTGDWADMESLSTHEARGSKAFEGRRYARDIEAVHQSLELFHAPINACYERQAAGHRARYKPRLVFTIGNHEDRIDRALNSLPELDGVIGIKDLHLAEHGWEVYPYKDTVDIGGWQCSHFHSSGTMGAPIGGVNAARQTLMKQHTSTIAGHAHTLDYSTEVRRDGVRIHALIAGVFCHRNFASTYCWARNTWHLWWRGVCILEGVEGGQCDELRFVSLRRIMEGRTE